MISRFHQLISRTKVVAVKFPKRCDFEIRRDSKKIDGNNLTIIY